MAEYDLTVKIILLGDFSVNKGTILRALSSLPEEPEVTCLASRHGVVEMLFLRDGKRVRVKIHDTAGNYYCYYCYYYYYYYYHHHHTTIIIQLQYWCCY